MKTYSRIKDSVAALVVGFACLFLVLAATVPTAYAEDPVTTPSNEEMATAPAQAPELTEPDQAGAEPATEETVSAQSAEEAEETPAEEPLVAQSDEGVPIFRLYNYITSEHLFTPSASEALYLANNYATLNWTYEGIAWQAPSTGTPVYRLYNPALGHLYTDSQYEINLLTTAHGWSMENNGAPLFYSGGSVAIYRLYNPYLNGLHMWTTSESEYNLLPDYQWTQEGNVFHALALGNADRFNTLPGYNPTAIPNGTKGWYKPTGLDDCVYVKDDGTLAKGWLVTSTTPAGITGAQQRYWLDPETGALTRNALVQTSDQTYAYAQDDGIIVRGLYDAGQNNMYIADNDGNLLWGARTNWVVDNFGTGLERYYIDPVTHAARSGFFTIEGYGKCYGTQNGYVLRGKMPFGNEHVLLADNDGKLLSVEGWTETDTLDGTQQLYRIDLCYKDDQGNKYYGAHTLLFSLNNSLFYGQPGVGYIARDQFVFANDGKPYQADDSGKLTLETKDWSLAVAPSGNVPDWGNDTAYTETMRARAIANGGSQQFYITVDNRIEGGGRVIIFDHLGDKWVALAGWYANVGRWNKSHTLTRSIAGIRPITDKIEEGTVANNPPWVIPYFTDYLHWIDPNGNDDGQGFHYTPNSNQQGNDMAGCTAFAEGRIEQAKWIWANVPLGSLVDICGVATPDLGVWENS